MSLEVAARLVWEPFWLALLIGVPSAVLYLLEVGVIVRHRQQFESSFYVLFINRAVLNLSNFATSYVGQRLPKLGVLMPLYLGLPRLVVCFFVFAPYYFFHAENLANFFLLLNRLNCIAHPHSYDEVHKWPASLNRIFPPFRIWRWLLFPSILLTVTLPLSICLRSFFLNAHFVKGDNGTGYTIDDPYFDGYKSWPKVWRVGDNYWSAVLGTFFCVACLLINLAAVICLKRQQRAIAAMTNAGEQRRKRADRRITIYALVSFLGQFLMALYYMYRYWSSSLLKPYIDAPTYQNLNEVAMNNYGWVNDLATIVLPCWLILWASDRMRAHIASDARRLSEWLRIGKWSAVQQTPATWAQRRLTQLQQQNANNNLVIGAVRVAQAEIAMNGTRRELCRARSDTLR